MDYRKFLGKTETLVLPHFGGAFVETQGRRLRLDAPLDPGWWRFEIKGRKATMLQPADTESSALENLPIVRGHLFGDRLVKSGAIAEPIFFLPADQPARFAPLRARAWPRGQLIFEAAEFESEVEEEVRRALEDRRTLAGVRGVPATLRAAFGYAMVIELGRRLGVSIAPAEVAGLAIELAGQEGAYAAAEERVRAIARAREEEARQQERRERIDAANTRAARIARARAEQAGADAEERADQALRAAGAEMLNTRSLAGDLLEVSYRVFGERFLTIVDRRTLQVIDAGVCLDGSDQLVTLESLPGVIRQAISEEHLVITRR